VAGSLRAIVCLGGFAWQAIWPSLTAIGCALPRPRPAFGHGATAVLARRDGPPILLIGCYHPSQQNTFTGRVTPGMLDEVLGRAKEYSRSIPGY
jgi:uracil-DNA glycosylase